MQLKKEILFLIEVINNHDNVDGLSANVEILIKVIVSQLKYLYCTVHTIYLSNKIE